MSALAPAGDEDDRQRRDLLSHLRARRSPPSAPWRSRLPTRRWSGSAPAKRTTGTARAGATASTARTTAAAPGSNVRPPQAGPSPGSSSTPPTRTPPGSRRWEISGSRAPNAGSTRRPTAADVEVRSRGGAPLRGSGRLRRRRDRPVESRRRLRGALRAAPDPLVVRVGAGRHRRQDLGGIFKSVDGGSTWRKLGGGLRAARNGSAFRSTPRTPGSSSPSCRATRAAKAPSWTPRAGAAESSAPRTAERPGCAGTR